VVSSQQLRKAPPATHEQISPLDADNLVFDLDGTLVDSIAGIERSLTAAFRAAGRPMPKADLRRLIGPSIDIIARRLDASLSDDEVLRIERHYRLGYDTDGWRHTVLFKDVADTLSTLKQRGHRLFIVTNKPRIPTENLLAYLDLRIFFEDVVCRDFAAPAYRSKAEMLRNLIERHVLLAGLTIMVGDTVEDNEAATANGLTFFQARYGYGDIAPYVSTIGTLKDLLALVATKPFSLKDAAPFREI
jgi:phosphoglycolate phosphatase